MMVIIVRPSYRLPPTAWGLYRRAGREAALSQKKLPPVKMENANRKGFVRGEAAWEPKPTPRPGFTGRDAP